MPDDKLDQLERDLKAYDGDDPDKAKKRLLWSLEQTGHSLKNWPVNALRSIMPHEREYKFGGREADLPNHIVHWGLIALAVLGIVAGIAALA